MDINQKGTLLRVNTDIHGSGNGLLLIKRLLGEEGNITLESKGLGHGTTVIVTFPILLSES